MAVKIRLMRIGGKKRPFYRVVAIDQRNKRSGKYLELLGTYNPLTDPHEINLKKDRIDYWQKMGAIFSEGFLRATGQAKKKPPRLPKKKPVQDKMAAEKLASLTKASSERIEEPEEPAASSKIVAEAQTEAEQLLKD